MSYQAKFGPNVGLSRGYPKIGACDLAMGLTLTNMPLPHRDYHAEFDLHCSKGTNK